MKNQAVGQFLKAEVEKQIDAEAVLESEKNAQNQVKNQTVANVQDKSLDPKFLEADLEGKNNAPKEQSDNWFNFNAEAIAKMQAEVTEAATDSGAEALDHVDVHHPGGSTTLTYRSAYNVLAA